MKIFEVVKRLDIPIEIVYQTAADIEKYPEFIPGILEAKLTKDSPNEVKLFFHYAIFSAHIISEICVKKNQVVEIRQKDGPFEVMNLIWSFESVLNNQTKVSFKMEYRSSGMISEIISGLLEKNSVKIMNSFIKRAEFVFRKLAPT